MPPPSLGHPPFFPLFLFIIRRCHSFFPRTYISIPESSGNLLDPRIRPRASSGPASAPSELAQVTQETDHVVPSEDALDLTVLQDRQLIDPIPVHLSQRIAQLGIRLDGLELSCRDHCRAGLSVRPIGGRDRPHAVQGQEADQTVIFLDHQSYPATAPNKLLYDPFPRPTATP